MTNEQHSITPPTHLVELWRADASNVPATLSTDPGGRRDYIDFIATAAAQWGADQELEAILEMVGFGQQSLPEEDRYLDGLTIASIRAARRPKPPSLKEQALDALQSMRISPELIAIINANTDLKNKYETIRRVLEALPND